MADNKCYTCKYCYTDALNDTICVNGDSYHCADYVETSQTCEHWAQIDEEDK